MKSSRLEEDKDIEENINKNVKNLFILKKLKKETHDATIKGIKNPFRLRKENKAIKYRILRDIRNLFEHEEEDYYKPVRVYNFGVTIILNIKVKTMEKHYQLKNILIKLDHT